MVKYEKRAKTYFAAANGYDGFRSNFDLISPPDCLDKIFIIKGGPGTGKSTLMHKIYEYYRSTADITTILCSSDPESLDGLLVEKNGVKIGIVDGTAPHTVDAKYPGAVEEIIDLADGFDLQKLRCSKEKIIAYSKKKSEYYLNGYRALNLSGEVEKYITECFIKSSKYNEAETLIKSVISDSTERYAKIKKEPYFISAFCKNGSVRLQNPETSKQVLRVGGDGLSEQIFMTMLFEILIKSSITTSIYSSAFSTKIPDLIETSTTVYTCADASDCSLDSYEFMADIDEYFSLKKSYDTYIDIAKHSLLRAAEYHFKLEDIYSSSVSFDKNDEKYLHVIEEMNALFDK